MTPLEWTKVKNRIESLWGRTQKWGTYGDVIAMVTHIPYGQAIRAVDQVIGSKYAPAPADIIAACKPDVSRIPRPASVDCPGHRFADITNPDGTRVEVCVRCLKEHVTISGGTP